MELERRRIDAADNRQTSPTDPQVDEVRDVEANVALAYPPSDRGAAAWRLLLVAFVFETLMWGFPLSFGIFQAYYSTLPQFEGNGYVSIIGTVASGLAYIAAPFVVPLVQWFPAYRQRLVMIGWPICIGGLITGSFAETIGGLIATQGVMYGIGFVIFYYPILSMVNDYWVARRGMAYGLLCAATGVSGAALPLAIQALLQQYGYQTTLRAIAIGLAITTGPLIPMLEGRDYTDSQTRSTNWTFLSSTRFWIFSIANVAMSLGFFFPALYLPSYAQAQGLSPKQGALLLLVMSLAQTAGQTCFGYLSDLHVSIELLTITSTLAAAVAVYVCWGLAQSFPVMIVFAALWGASGNGFTALWARMGSSISNDPDTAFTAYSTFNLGKGLANVSAGVIGSSLIRGDIVSHVYGALRFERLILFTGTSMLASSLIVGLYSLRHCHAFITTAV